jgi:hypothetical protein
VWIQTLLRKKRRRQPLDVSCLEKAYHCELK